MAISLIHKKWGATEGFVGKEKSLEHWVSSSQSSAQGSQHLRSFTGHWSGFEAGSWAWTVEVEKGRRQSPHHQRANNPHSTSSLRTERSSRKAYWESRGLNKCCCCPPGSPVPGILQARTLEWVVRLEQSNSEPQKTEWSFPGALSLFSH